VNNMARHIRSQFPDQKHHIDLLMAKDPEFLDLCEDHDACVDALHYWAKSEKPEAETRANEYHILVQDLQEEITQALAALESKQSE